jgi:HK97 family phage portal protein
MSVRTWLLEKLGGVPAEQLEKRSWEVVLNAYKENRQSANGIVTPESSLRLSAVFACVRVLAETMASIPLQMYERKSKGERERITDHPLIRVLDDPNPYMTQFDVTETLVQHLALRGNAFCQIDYDERGRIVGLWPLPPQNIIESKIQGDQRLYLYQDEKDTRWISSEIIWHLRGIGNGLWGYSPIGLMRRAVSLGLSAEEFGWRFFENDARPGIVLEHPGKLSDEAHKNLRESFEEAHKGLSKSHRATILEEGMKIHEVGIPPEDAQFLETRKFQVTEIARIFRVPPHMIADLERSTNNNIEHQGIEYVKFSILPWARRIEQSAKKNLMLPQDRQRYFLEYLMAGLERGDIGSRYQAYAVGRQNGWLSANDIRKLENMNPVDGGDVYLVPLNMVPADMVGEFDSTDTPPGGTPDTARSLPAGHEERSLRSARTRHRLAAAQRRVILDVAERVMRRETHDVGEAVRKYLGKRDSGQFLIWLEEFYKEHQKFMTRQFLPVFLAYAETVAAEAMDEVGAEEDLQERLERFVKSYTGSFAASQAGISLHRLKTALQEALHDGLDAEEALQAELDHWRAARPGEIATEQSTRANNAAAKFVYAAVNVKIIRWVSFGETCPYCKRLDGRTISITKNFLSPGDQLEGDEEHQPLTTTTNVGHPPAHDGCDCMITAG